jgi:hypothetical protein
VGFGRWLNLSKAWSLFLQKVEINSPHLLDKEMTTHSSILAWGLPWTEESWATVHGVTMFKVKFVLQSNTGGIDLVFVDVICHLNMWICFK